MTSPFSFLTGGEMDTLMRARDWQATPAGSPETWPSMRKTDACRQTPGPRRHPRAPGQAGRAFREEARDLRAFIQVKLPST